MLDRAPVMISALALLVLCALSAATAACTKSEGPPSGTTSSASTASATPAPSATVSAAAAAAAPDASPVAADTTTGTAPTAGATDAATPTIATAVASGAAPKASAGGARPEFVAANAACGVKPQPDCPLQAWMKTNTNPAIASNDLPALATALDKTVSFAPAGYGNWASIAKDGAKAAKAGDMTAAKASCRTCHDQYKAKYKADLRGRKI